MNTSTNLAAKGEITIGKILNECIRDGVLECSARELQFRLETLFGIRVQDAIDTSQPVTPVDGDSAGRAVRNIRWIADDLKRAISAMPVTLPIHSTIVNYADELIAAFNAKSETTWHRRLAGAWTAETLPDGGKFVVFKTRNHMWLGKFFRADVFLCVTGAGDQFKAEEVERWMYVPEYVDAPADDGGGNNG